MHQSKLSLKHVYSCDPILMDNVGGIYCDLE